MKKVFSCKKFEQSLERAGFSNMIIDLSLKAWGFESEGKTEKELKEDEISINPE